MSDGTPTLADRVRALEADTGSAFEREPLADGTIAMRLRQPNGTVLVGVGATTADAVTDLERRVRAFATALAQES